jgi:hypothetical protein
MAKKRIHVMCRACHATARRVWDGDRCACYEACECGGGYGGCPKGCRVNMRPATEVRRDIEESQRMDAVIAGLDVDALTKGLTDAR